MRFPVYYRRKSHMLFVWLVLIIGLLGGAFDVALEYYTTEFNVHRYNCAAIGCFQDKWFRAYWGISNMVGTFLLLRERERECTVGVIINNPLSGAQYHCSRADHLGGSGIEFDEEKVTGTNVWTS